MKRMGEWWFWRWMMRLEIDFSVLVKRMIMAGSDLSVKGGGCHQRPSLLKTQKGSSWEKLMSLLVFNSQSPWYSPSLQVKNLSTVSLITWDLNTSLITQLLTSTTIESSPGIIPSSRSSNHLSLSLSEELILDHIRPIRYRYIQSSPLTYHFQSIIRPPPINLHSTDHQIQFKGF